MSGHEDPLRTLLQLPHWSKLQRRLQHLFDPNRAAGWVAGLSALLLVLGLGWLLLRPEEPALLRVDGVFYTPTGRSISSIPAASEQIGTLHHISTGEPETLSDWTGYGLPPSWTGCPIYQDTPLRKALYLGTGTGYRIFVPEPPPSLLPGVQPWVLEGPRPEVALSEFPQTVFRWDGARLLAVTDYGEEVLFACGPRDRVWFADLNGDGRREICGAILSDETVTHRKVVVYDWADRICAALDAPRVWDYTLTLHDFRLYVQRWHFQGLEPVSQAPLILKGGTLTADWP